MGIPLYIIYCFSLAAFNICSLCLIFVILINLCLGIFLLEFILFGSLWVSLSGYFFSCFTEVFNYCCSLTQSFPTLCDPIDYSMPGFPVFHYLPELAQTHVHWVGNANQPSCPVPSPPAFYLSQHQGLFQCVSSSHQVAKVLELQHQAPSGLISFRTDWFDFLAVQGTLKRLLQHYNLKASILRAQCSLWSNFHIHTWLLEKL